VVERKGKEMNDKEEERKDEKKEEKPRKGRSLEKQK
jgi:hypothetical protein